MAGRTGEARTTHKGHRDLPGQGQRTVGGKVRAVPRCGQRTAHTWIDPLGAPHRVTTAFGQGRHLEEHQTEDVNTPTRVRDVSRRALPGCGGPRECHTRYPAQDKRSKGIPESVGDGKVGCPGPNGVSHATWTPRRPSSNFYSDGQRRVGGTSRTGCRDPAPPTRDADTTEAAPGPDTQGRRNSTSPGRCEGTIETSVRPNSSPGMSPRPGT